MTPIRIIVCDKFFQRCALSATQEAVQNHIHVILVFILFLPLQPQNFSCCLEIYLLPIYLM